MLGGSTQHSQIIGMLSPEVYRCRSLLVLIWLSVLKSCIWSWFQLVLPSVFQFILVLFDFLLMILWWVLSRVGPTLHLLVLVSWLQKSIQGDEGGQLLVFFVSTVLLFSSSLFSCSYASTYGPLLILLVLMLLASVDFSILQSTDSQSAELGLWWD